MVSLYYINEKLLEEIRQSDIYTVIDDDARNLLNFVLDNPRLRGYLNSAARDSLDKTTELYKQMQAKSEPAPAPEDRHPELPIRHESPSPEPAAAEPPCLCGHRKMFHAFRIEESSINYDRGLIPCSFPGCKCSGYRTDGESYLDDLQAAAPSPEPEPAGAEQVYSNSNDNAATKFCNLVIRLHSLHLNLTNDVLPILDGLAVDDAPTDALWDVRGQVAEFLDGLEITVKVKK